MATENTYPHPLPGSARTPAPNRTLYRHPADKRLAGVCGGLGDYFNIDPVLIRLLLILAAIGTGGAAILVYAALWLMLPVGTQQTGKRESAPIALGDDNLRRVAFVLIGFGLLWLLANTGILPGVWDSFWSIMAVIFWPALLIAGGWLLLRRSGATAEVKAHMPDGESLKQGLYDTRRRIPFKRTVDDRLLLGVCGGLARTFNIDANIVRLLWTLFSIGSLGTGVILYVLLAIVFPEDEPTGIEAVEGEILDPIA